jgi:serine/threonine protein kinase
MINNRYKIFEGYIGKGSFGHIYKAIDIVTNMEVAAKFEKTSSTYHLLEYEAKVLNNLKDLPGFPKVYWFGEFNDCSVMIMQLFGLNMEEILNKYKRHIPIKVVFQIGYHITSYLQSLHEQGFNHFICIYRYYRYLHRDIKPENLLIGVGEQSKNVFLIDFGLSKKYIDYSTKEHIIMKTNKQLTGTPRYATVNAHLGLEQSRRDDLESLGYVYNLFFIFCFYFILSRYWYIYLVAFFLGRTFLWEVVMIITTMTTIILPLHSQRNF